MRKSSTPHILASLTVFAFACGKREPSFDEKLRAYEAAIDEAVKLASPAYARLATIRANLGTETPVCTEPPPSGAMGISSNRLKVLTGEPSNAQGWLVAKTDPTPYGVWDAPPMGDLPGTNRPPLKSAGEPSEAKQRIAASAAAVLAAPAFVVQRIDAYVAPAITSTTLKDPRRMEGTFERGSIEGRIVVFDNAGTPKCHYPYKARSSGMISGTDAPMDTDLARNQRTAIDEAMKK